MTFNLQLSIPICSYLWSYYAYILHRQSLFTGFPKKKSHAFVFYVMFLVYNHPQKTIIPFFFHHTLEILQ